MTLEDVLSGITIVFIGSTHCIFFIIITIRTTNFITFETVAFIGFVHYFGNMPMGGIYKTLAIDIIKKHQLITFESISFRQGKLTIKVNRGTAINNKLIIIGTHITSRDELPLIRVFHCKCQRKLLMLPC